MEVTSRIAVGRDVAEALDDLQREWWRIERREARHTLSLDAMLPQVLADPSSNPEEMLARRYESRRWLARSQHSPQFR